MPTISTMLGHENFPDRSARVSLTCMKSRAFPGKGGEIAIVSRANDPFMPIAKIGPGSILPAGQGMSPQIVGAWTQQGYEVPEGMILRLGVQRREVAGAISLGAGILLRVRADAAHRRIAVILTGHFRASITRAPIEGRFDILTVEEAARLGVLLPPAYAMQHKPENTTRGFEVVEIEPERASPIVQQTTTVEDSQGREVEIVTHRRRRALDLE